MTRARGAALLLFTVGLIAGCGDSTTDPADKPPSAAQTAEEAPREGSDCIPPTTSRYARSREDLIGLSLSEARSAETAAGHDIRVLGESGVCADAHDDLDRNRVNVVMQDGKIIWASMY
ncbi:hypothetical protein ACFVP3_33100 [Streptomyces sp. NPDC057806]|uniref:hypothetical protein n=1 Tax=unclassified Streptomyces TaxID=2593676 RepID=UPI0036828DDE